MVFFILQSASDDIKGTQIISSAPNKFQVDRELEKVALNFIKEEEGNKKAKNAFVTNLEELKKDKYNIGYYLIRNSENGNGSRCISVYEKKKNIGFLSIYIDIVESHFYIGVEYNFTKDNLTLSFLKELNNKTNEKLKNIKDVKDVKDVKDNNVKCIDNANTKKSSNISGVQGDLLKELKERLKSIRLQIG